MFTVVIPVYNKLPHLERSINSVLQQTFRNFELLLVDDASTDGSYEKLLEFKDERINLYRRSTPGPGGYAARNLGIRNAKFEWIAFLDADDEWNPDYLANAFAILQNSKDAGFLASCYQKRDGRTVETVNGSVFIKHSEIQLQLTNFINFTIAGAPPLWTSAVIVKREVLSTIGGFPEGIYKRGGDIETWLKVVAAVDGKWSSFNAATYYQDTVNMVSKSVPDETPAPYFGVRDLLQSGQFRKKERLLLKKFNNYYQQFPIIMAKRSGKLKPVHFSGYFAEASVWEFLKLKAYCLLPINALRFYSRIKQRISVNK